VIRCIDPDARSPDAGIADSWTSWPGGGLPHFASVVVGRVAHVSDETSDLSGDEIGNSDPTAEAAAALSDARARLAEIPAEVVVTNHVMGLYELAAIHLSTDPPDLGSAALAIDAVGCLVEGLGPRLGEDASTMRDALANIRMAFVQLKGVTGQTTPSDG
jgi:hypothetical protein